MFVSKIFRIWLVISAFVVLWDAGFILLRPHTLPGGKYHSFWKPYAKYIQLDTLYNDEKDIFVRVQSVFNIFEAFLTFLASMMLCIKNVKLQVAGSVLALIVSCFTYWKTCIYFFYDEGFINFNNSTFDLVMLFLIPNLIWIVMPFLAIVSISRGIYFRLSLNLKNKNE